MTTQTKSMRGARQASRAAHDEPKSARKRKDASMQSDIERRAARIRALPGIVLLAVVVIVLLPQMLSMTLGAAGRAEQQRAYGDTALGRRNPAHAAGAAADECVYRF
jgi:hypothetical protein